MHLIRNIRHCNENRNLPGNRPAPAAASDTLDATGGMLRKVLVVDDETDLADMTAILLGARGLEVVVAYSGHEAIQALEKHSDIDAVFSDVVMPGMTGLQLADAVRSLYPQVKIVLASGYTVPSLLSGRERPYLYTPKPYKIDAVLRLLHS